MKGDDRKMPAPGRGRQGGGQLVAGQEKRSGGPVTVFRNSRFAAMAVPLRPDWVSLVRLSLAESTI